ncbi:MAG TPA: hypothetical protein VI669_17920 [Vicinamibacteria bacterium]
MKCLPLSFSIILAAQFVLADEPPAIDHQPVPCTVPAKAIALCAGISDDQNVSAARVYFRKAGADFYSFVDMSFGGINYCATLPAPREGKIKLIEYYVQAVDDGFQAQRTSTFQLSIVPEGKCEFPPLEKDPKRAAAIKVFATNKKQGARLDDAFDRLGVSYVPLGAK